MLKANNLLKFHEENMKFDYPNWSHCHHRYWVDIVDAHLKPQEPIMAIEVGCFEGRSTIWFADHLLRAENSRMYCIDGWCGGEEIDRLKLGYDMEVVKANFLNNISEHPMNNKISVISDMSEKALSGLMSMYREIDFIYLDGSHTQRDTLVDLIYCTSLIKKGGVIIVDDYLNKMATNNQMLRPKAAVDFIVKSMDDEFDFFTTPENQGVLIRTQL